MSEKVVVVGAGINGLVATHYLRRAGWPVLLLERKDRVGGACTFATFEHAGRQYRYPTGASLIGMMQDFVFRETGLDRRLPLHRAAQPPLVYFHDEPDALQVHGDGEAFAAEARARWGEAGDVPGYARDLARVRAFLIAGYREAAAPSLEVAVGALGEPLVRRWITGHARGLLDHYFTADRTKIFHSMQVTESGPVPMDEPGTAFNAAVMATGSVLGGGWGHVAGGLWRLPLALADIHRELGVEIVTGATVLSVGADRTVRFSAGGRERSERAAAVFFATDPVTAAEAVGDDALRRAVARRRYLGSSGKVVLFYREPVVWKGGWGDDFASATRYLYAIDDFTAFRRSSDSMRSRGVAFSPSCFQVYCEGAAQRCLGRGEDYDYISVFFKDVGFGLPGSELPQVRRHVESVIAARIENPEALFHSVLLTPRDLRDTFFFPEGNIDHQELRGGQNFAERGFSDDPALGYYRLGRLERVYYCGAGSYPCGSVAGTPGYMAATQFLRE